MRKTKLLYGICISRGRGTLSIAYARDTAKEQIEEISDSKKYQQK